MHITQDIINLIIDQLFFEGADQAQGASRYGIPASLVKDLQATSLVSTDWVHHSQRLLFSTLTIFVKADVQKWRTRIKPGHCGLSRYVRTLNLGPYPLHSNILKSALPHFNSFRNLKELVGFRADISRLSLGALIPVLTSSAATLKRLRWRKFTNRGAWEPLYALTDRLPNLVEIELTGYPLDSRFIPPPTLRVPRIQLSLSPGDQPVDPLAFKHFKFQGLRTTVSVPPSPQFLAYCSASLRVLDFMGIGYGNSRLDFEALVGACHALQEINFRFCSFIGQALGSCPSNSVSLVRIYNPSTTTIGDYNAHILRCSREPCHTPEHRQMVEYENLGVSIRKIAQRFSDHNPGSRTLVKLMVDPSVRTTCANSVDSEIPIFMTKLGELKTHITLELDLLPPPMPSR